MCDDRPRFACDAMCGGLARWLRAIGYDTTYEADVDDGDLVAQAQRERRILISSDGKMFERRVLVTGALPGLLLPGGLKLMDQIRYVVRGLGLPICDPRCMACNGTLEPRTREEVGSLVPARSLIWADTFFQCDQCGQAFWNGTHWRKIEVHRSALATLGSCCPIRPASPSA